MVMLWQKLNLYQLLQLLGQKAKLGEISVKLMCVDMLQIANNIEVDDSTVVAAALDSKWYGDVRRTMR